MRRTRILATVGMALAATAVLSGPANAAVPAQPTSQATAQSTALVAQPPSVLWTTVGPYSTWEACDSDRRLYATRYKKKTQQCFLHTNGYYYFKYE